MAYVSAAINNLGNNVSAKNLQDELDKTVGEGKTYAEDNSDSIIKVEFYDTEHYYLVDKGNVSKTDEPIYGEISWYSFEEYGDGYAITAFSDEVMNDVLNDVM